MKREVFLAATMPPEDPDEELPGPATGYDPFEDRSAGEETGGDWRAYCPTCGGQAADLTDQEPVEADPWIAAANRALGFEERDYYCDACGAFVNLKEAHVWRRGSRN